MTVEADQLQSADPAANKPADDALAPEPAAVPLSGKLVAITAMAAGLVLGFLLAASFGIGSDIHSGDGLLVARGVLAAELSDQISATGGVGPSFWSREGEFCRVFATGAAAGRGLSGIACRESGNWRIRIVTATAARGELPAAVRDLMQNLIVGQPLDAAAERQARRQGWRAS